MGECAKLFSFSCTCHFGLLTTQFIGDKRSAVDGKTFNRILQLFSSDREGYKKCGENVIFETFNLWEGD